MPATNNFYQLLIETTDEGVWVIDEKNETSFVNDRMAEMIGYTTDEMQGRTLFDFMDEEGIAITERNIERRKQGIKELHEFKLISKSGNPVWTYMNTSPIIEDGVYKGALAMVSDITEKKRQERELKESYRNYVSLFEESPVPIWEEDFSQIKKYIDELKKEKGITDLKEFMEGNINEVKKCASLMIVNNVNQAVVELNEAGSKQEVLDNFKELISKASPGYTIKEIIAIDKGETSCEFETELITFGGNKRHVHLKWNVVEGHEEDYSKVYLTTTDITERILEDNLSLQQSNREKEVLLKEVHHRVKNNLQIISSLLKLQSHSIEDEKIKELFEICLDRVHSMALVHEHLYKSNNFSKIDYENYVRELVTPLIEIAKGLDHSIDFRLKADNIILNINTALPLGLLINEIVTNALKHGIKDDDGIIDIEIEHSTNENYVLKIGDNGVGIKAEDLNKKTDSLGMQLIHNLTDQLMGEIRMDNSKKGTHYIITFKEVS